MTKIISNMRLFMGPISARATYDRKRTFEKKEKLEVISKFISDSTEVKPDVSTKGTSPKQTKTLESKKFLNPVELHFIKKMASKINDKFKNFDINAKTKFIKICFYGKNYRNSDYEKDLKRYKLDDKDYKPAPRQFLAPSEEEKPYIQLLNNSTTAKLKMQFNQKALKILESKFPDFSTKKDQNTSDTPLGYKTREEGTGPRDPDTHPEINSYRGQSFYNSGVEITEVAWDRNGNFTEIEYLHLSYKERDLLERTRGLFWAISDITAPTEQNPALLLEQIQQQQESRDKLGELRKDPTFWHHLLDSVVESFDRSDDYRSHKPTEEEIAHIKSILSKHCEYM